MFASSLQKTLAYGDHALQRVTFILGAILIWPSELLLMKTRLALFGSQAISSKRIHPFFFRKTKCLEASGGKYGRATSPATRLILERSQEFRP